MGIFLGNTAPSKIFVGGSEVASVRVGDTKVWPTIPTESIIYRMRADSGKLYIPLSGMTTGGAYGASYNWKISVDDGPETTYSGTGGNGTKLTLNGYTGSNIYTIRITPVNDTYGRARAFGFVNTSVAGRVTEIIYDGSYKGFATSETNTGNYFRYRIYTGCTQITSVPKETLPNTVTTIGTYFRAALYQGCTSLQSAAEEFIPSSVTSIGNNFRSTQYDGCTKLTLLADEVLPSGITTIGNGFRSSQYQGCTKLTATAEEALPSTITSIGTSFRSQQYRNCTALTEIKGWKDLSIGANYYRQNQFLGSNSNKTVKVLSDVGYASYNTNTLPNAYVTSVSVPSAYLSNYTSSTLQPRVGIDDAKFIGY